ncbi:hypothetical protein ACFVGY_00040 [Streptomyces sp. NPDC127106]|uniref:hypothetical protein n=1 Tax=Streptomyces sp. NPDC127106 TaxID=3345360 RepID=UPI003638676E
MFAASTAIAAGGVLVPGTAFAAAPAAPHAVTVGSDDISDGNKSTLLFLGKPDNTIRTAPYEDLHKGGTGKKGDGGWGKNRPGKGGSAEDTGVKVPEKMEWQCVRAPCGPPDGGHTEEAPDDAAGTGVPTRS